jgi:hypothetical protein
MRWDQMTAVAALLAASGCYPTGSEEPEPNERPGDLAWQEGQVTCDADRQCKANERCLDGVCQLIQCNNGPYDKTPPIAEGEILVSDHDLAAASRSGAAVHGIPLTVGAGAGSPTEWRPREENVVDLAGGNFLPGVADEVAVAYAGSTEVTVIGTDGEKRVDFGLEPAFLTAGDVNGRGYDEVIALGREDGQVVVKWCDVDTGECEKVDLASRRDAVPARASLTGAIDVAAGDIDGDGSVEIVVLFETAELLGINLDAGATDQAVNYYARSKYALRALAVGDLNGDAQDEVVGLRVTEGGTELHIFTLMQGFADYPEDRLPLIDAPVAVWSGPSGVRDIAVGDIERDGVGQVLALRGDEIRILGKRVTEITIPDPTRPSTESEVPLNESLADYETRYAALPGQYDRLAAVDIDGDSVSARLVSEPRLLQGRPVPTIAAFFPPYWAELSDRPANVYVGDSLVETEGRKKGIQHTVAGHIEFAPKFDFFGLRAGVVTQFKVARSVGRAQVNRLTSFTGTRMWTQADPKVYGPRYGQVQAVFNCFQQYRYELVDSGGVIDFGQGDTPEDMIITIPVESAITLLSTTRWNALAEALGNLPVIQVPHQIGDPTSYPNQLVTLEGEPVPPQKLVVPSPPRYVVGEVGFVGFWLALWEMVADIELTTMEYGGMIAPQVGWFEVGVQYNQARQRESFVELGTEVVFGGQTPTLPDDPTTPEDEFALGLYTFAPIIYRENYTDAAGKESQYYVYHFMGGLPSRGDDGSRDDPP